MKKVKRFLIWVTPWWRSTHLDIVFKSGKVMALEVWDFSCRRVENELVHIESRSVDGAGFQYINLSEVAGIFHRRGRIRWYGFGFGN